MNNAILILPTDTQATTVGLYAAARHAELPFDVLLITHLAEGDAEPTLCLPAGAQRILQLTGAAAQQSFDLLPWAETFAELLMERRYHAVLAASGEQSGRLLPMLAEKLDVPCLLDLTSCQPLADGWAVEKPVYGMNLTANYHIAGPQALFSLSVPDSPSEDWYPVSAAEKQPFSSVPGGWFSDLTVTPCETTDEIADAVSLLAVGRGIGGKNGVHQAKNVAEKLGAKFACTRPVVQDMLAPHEKLIGISGTMVKPERCVIMAASGAAPFAVGVEKSGTIFGVNADIHAPLFDFCDYGVVEDVGAFLEALNAQLESVK